MNGFIMTILSFVMSIISTISMTFTPVTEEIIKSNYDYAKSFDKVVYENQLLLFCCLFAVQSAALTEDSGIFVDVLNVEDHLLRIDLHNPGVQSHAQDIFLLPAGHKTDTSEYHNYYKGKQPYRRTLLFPLEHTADAQLRLLRAAR